MANRRDFFYLELVTEDELNAGFDGLEQADFNEVVDLGFVGIASGAGVTQHSPTPDLTVDVAIGTAYDQQGRRMRVPSLQVVSLAADSNSVSTAVVSPGQSKIVSLFLRFKRNESDPRTDGNGDPVNFVQDEGFEFVVVQGAEALSPTPPSPLTNGILLVDVTRTFGQTQIVNGNISATRRAWTFRTSSGSLSIAVGTAAEAVTALLTELANHIAGVSNTHPATAVSYAGGPAWADSSTNPLTTVEAQIDKMITDLSGSGGGAKLGLGARTTWLGGRTNPAATVFAGIDKIITDLAATAAGDDGAERIGAQGSGNLSTGSVRSQLDELDAEKGALASPNTWTNTNTFSSTVTLDDDTTLGTNAEIVLAEDNAKAGTGHIRQVTRAGTGANDGESMTFAAQNGQAQSGANANNHGGGFRFRLGEPGAGGSGAAGRSHGTVLEHQATNFPKRRVLMARGATAVAAAATNVAILKFDRVAELESLGTAFLLQFTGLMVETTGGTPTVGGWKKTVLARFSGGSWSFIGSQTADFVDHNFAGGTPAMNFAINGTTIEVQANGPSVACTASASCDVFLM